MAVSENKLQPAQWRGIAVASGVAVLLFLGFRALPTGTNLSHMDFRPGGNSVEMCDPSNPQFIPVVTVRSPVTLTVDAPQAEAGRIVEGTARLLTASGRPINPEDLQVVHTRKLHLLVVDPSLRDYQHVHPEPGREPGTWTFSFSPRTGAVYRFFADFTPVATGRGLYGFADLPVSGSGEVPALESGLWNWSLEGADSVKAGKQATLALEIAGADGAPVPLETVMGAYAHLVAFDQQRLGYAHLHPLESDPAWRPDPNRPRLTFTITIPAPGSYAVWAQVQIGGREVYHAFPVTVH